MRLSPFHAEFPTAAAVGYYLSPFGLGGTQSKSMVGRQAENASVPFSRHGRRGARSTVPWTVLQPRREHLAVLDPIRNHLDGQPLGVADGLFAGFAVGHHAGEFRRFGDPATIVFAVQFDGKVHTVILQQRRTGAFPFRHFHCTL